MIVYRALRAIYVRRVSRCRCRRRLIAVKAVMKAGKGVGSCEWREGHCRESAGSAVAELSGAVLVRVF